MFDFVFKLFRGLLTFFTPFLVFAGSVAVLFSMSCFIWFLIFRFRDKLPLPDSEYVKDKRRPLVLQLLVDVPRRYMLDRFQRQAGAFGVHGIHMFCGEQGCGKTIACVEMMLRLQKSYPRSKMITNFAVTSEDDTLADWRDLLDYVNGIYGVIVGLDEIQNWFQSGLNKMPVEMLEVVTQNRKNRRIMCCTAQVFTRVNKALREQVTLVYNPHTFLGCFTVVIRRKPVFDSEGNVIQMKYRGMYAFVHTDKLRSSYDTYKVIHTLAREGFKEQAPAPVTNVYLASSGKRR